MRRIPWLPLGLLLTARVALAGTIGMSGAPAQIEQTATILPFVVTPIYVVIEGPPAQVDGIEYGIAHGSETIVVGVSYNPQTSICVDCAPWDDYIAGFGACYDFGTTWTFATISLMAVATASDISFCVQPASSSSFEPPTPGLSTCSQELVPLEVSGGPYPAPGCLLLNPTGVATAETGWSALKSRYRATD